MKRIKKGDTVKVIAGKDKGEEGEVLQVLPKENRVIVNGVNLMKRHRKARQVGRQQLPAQIVEFDAPMDLSNVMLICPSCKQPTRIGFRFVQSSKGGQEATVKVRYCKKCDANIDKPEQ
ncbi:MAG: 50S ribosomal protein L24 [Anaerolineae bacterium]|jgi:large subunit ribosomal protein L24|nr:50S ribosomal protein L24 [Anaerolineae bacterium]